MMSSQLETCGASSGLAARAITHVPPDGGVEKRPQLLVELAVALIAAEQGEQAGEDTACNANHHASPSVARMMRVIAAVWASHSRAASESRRRPAAVSA